MTEFMNRIAPNAPETASQDGLTLNVERLQALFPEAFSEGRLDFEVLKELLGAQIEMRPEKYGLNWHGKTAARRHALTPTRATLRPDPESSVDWDTTQNLMIEGDNLEVLKLLQRSYAGKVKLIYIDPPYNTGKDFVYPDDYTDSIANYQSLTGQSEEGRRISSNTESSGRFHTDWLNMMYPRLKLARELLSDDGAIFVSIDDSELSKLRVLLDSIFGEENFLANFSWTTDGNFDNQAKVKVTHEYIILYAKSAQDFPHPPVVDPNVSSDSKLFNPEIRNTIVKNGPKNPISKITLPVGFPADFDNGVISAKGDSWPVYLSDAKIRGGVLQESVVLESGWSSKDLLLEFINNNFDPIYDGKDQKTTFLISRTGAIESIKQRSDYQSHVISTLTGFGGPQKAAAQLSSIGAFFNGYPKPVELLRYFVRMGFNNDGIILDFFAGSGTTGHAVMAQNAADSGKRQYILVQLPEPLDPSKAEQKTAADFCTSLGVPLNIAELTKERLRRAGAKVKAENPMFAGDTGFKVFKLDSSNLTEWDAVAAKADLEQALENAVNNIKVDRSEQDVLFELLLKLGLELTTPIETQMIAGKQVHSVGAGALMVCLERGINDSNVSELGQGMADWTEQQDAAGGSQLVFLDNGFAGDMSKSNLTTLLEQRAKALGRTWTVRSI